MRRRKKMQSPEEVVGDLMKTSGSLSFDCQGRDFLLFNFLDVSTTSPMLVLVVSTRNKSKPSSGVASFLLSSLCRDLGS